VHIANIEIMLVKCKTCNNEVKIVHEIRTCENHFWCEKCKLAESIYKFDDDTFNKFYKIDRKK